MCAICGLFGSHKGHKIITGVELKKLNNNMITETKKYINEAMEFDKLKKCQTVREYAESILKSRVSTIRKTVTGIYEVSLKGNRSSIE